MRRLKRHTFLVPTYALVRHEAMHMDSVTQQLQIKVRISAEEMSITYAQLRSPLLRRNEICVEL